MKTRYQLALASLALVAGPAIAQDMGGDMKNMHGMAHAAKMGQATGVITAIDPKAGTLTINHGAIPAIGWPAMTMTFKANPSTLLKGLGVEQEIAFDCTARGMTAEVTAIHSR